MLALVDQACASGDLMDYRPLFAGAETRRRLLFPPELHEEIRDRCKFRLRYDLGVLHADLAVFVSGQILTFADGAHKSCMLKILDPKGNEVWEIRSRGVRPGARVFGLFAAPDVFVVTSMTDRADTDFVVEIRRAKAAWRKLFNTYPPFSGGTPHDYITENLIDLRAEKTRWGSP